MSKIKRFILPLVILIVLAGGLVYLEKSDFIVRGYSRKVLNDVYYGRIDGVYKGLTANAKEAVNKQDFKSYIETNFGNAQNDSIKVLSVEHKEDRVFVDYLVKKNGSVDIPDDYIVTIVVKKSPYLFNNKVDDIQFQSGKSL